MCCYVLAVIQQNRQSFWSFWGRGQKEDEIEKELEERAKSEGATPVGSPQKWTPGEQQGGGRERGKVGVSLLPAGGVVRKREVLSSDEDGEEVGVEVATRPRQRSLRRNKKIGFTNILTSEQLVSPVLGHSI